ncbi:MAG: hypothetical protein FD123_2589 [Bacteroidetes bacterium]|nr:MAG: hypothetical protein FD123_2589 [Bacteroidota bacterium]
MKLPLLPDRFTLAARILLAIFTIIGITGILLYPSWFAKLTPFNILLGFILFIAFMPEFPANRFRFFVLVFAVGIGVELIGTETGKIFGAYHYGDALGPKIKNVPAIIGINWLLLVCCTMDISVRLPYNIYVKSAAGALLMTGLDVLIEPLCSRLDFWHWNDGTAPLRNYLAWFVISFFLHMVGNSMEIGKRNPLSVFIFGMQLLFFTALLIASKLT